MVDHLQQKKWFLLSFLIVLAATQSVEAKASLSRKLNFIIRKAVVIARTILVFMALLIWYIFWWWFVRPRCQPMKILYDYSVIRERAEGHLVTAHTLSRFISRKAFYSSSSCPFNCDIEKKTLPRPIIKSLCFFSPLIQRHRSNCFAFV